uniref:Uncharacterized protein n=1 Tax=Glossina pallidipes TaxID=7398 RepID=A0A1B0AJ18_GLOPL
MRRSALPKYKAANLFQEFHMEPQCALRTKEVLRAFKDSIPISEKMHVALTTAFESDLHPLHRKACTTLHIQMLYSLYSGMYCLKSASHQKNMYGSESKHCIAYRVTGIQIIFSVNIIEESFRDTDSSLANAKPTERNP